MRPLYGMGRQVAIPRYRCAGFIGSTLTERLLSAGHAVVGYDNFSTGQESFLVTARESPNFRLVRGDVLDQAALTQSMNGSEFVFHLAANADVRFGTAHPAKDLEQNTIATHHVLDAMRQNGVDRIAFSSSGSVYGESLVIPTPEDAPYPVQTSLYGASKAAGEGLIAAYCSGFGFQSYIFQLPVGSVRRLESAETLHQGTPQLKVAYSPENLRLGRAVDDFLRPQRIVVGVRSSRDRDLLARYRQRKRLLRMPAGVQESRIFLGRAS